MGNELNKQTAVEWYSNKLLEILGESVNNFTTEQTMANHYALKQAKQMEKEQIKDAYFLGGHDVKNNRYKGMHEYYNQTYGGNK
jgi:hypothetical protein